MTIRISGVGCCLMDRIYDNVDFQSEAFRKYLSRKTGDGGLEPGKLTFEEELERFNRLDLTDEEREMIFHKNAEKLLKL